MTSKSSFWVCYLIVPTACFFLGAAYEQRRNLITRRQLGGNDNDDAEDKASMAKKQNDSNENSNSANEQDQQVAASTSTSKGVSLPTIKKSKAKQKTEESNQDKPIRMVVQRFRFSRIVVYKNEASQVSQGGSTSKQKQEATQIFTPTTEAVGYQCDLLTPPPTSTGKCTDMGVGGLVVYISFGDTTTPDMVKRAAVTLANLPILTRGQWGDGGKTVSALSLGSQLYQDGQKKAKQNPEMNNENKANANTNIYTSASTDANSSGVAIVVVPQANLISKVKSLGKSIQYHGQCQDKQRGQELYHLFVRHLTFLAYEQQVQATTACLRNAQTISTNSTTSSSTGKKSKNSSSSSATAPNVMDASVPPKEIFKRFKADSYASFDEATGMPTSNAQGGPLTKSALKKIKKIYEAHEKRHEKYLASQQSMKTASKSNMGKDKVEMVRPLHQEGFGKNSQSPQEQAQTNRLQTENTMANGETHATVVEPPLDPRFMKIVSGTFGKRQALELASDMGPFCHILNVG